MISFLHQATAIFQSTPAAGDPGAYGFGRNARTINGRDITAIKDGRTRDPVTKQEAAFYFEMEAAGLMEDFPCVAIWGLCDYADLHKTDKSRSTRR